MCTTAFSCTAGTATGLRSPALRSSPSSAPPSAALIRADLDVPVLQLQTESDLTLFRAYPARQPDTKLLRTWEIAGASHADFYQGGVGYSDVGDGKAEQALLDVASADGGPLNCAQPINRGPQYLVLASALDHLDRWVADGVAPPKARSIDMVAGAPPVISRDARGNALGGIRTPVVDVPTATLRGDGNAGATFCFLFGNTVPFDAATIAALYPTHRDYVTKFDRATDAAVKAGFLLAADAKNLKAAAACSSVQRPVGGVKLQTEEIISPVAATTSTRGRPAPAIACSSAPGWE